MTRPVIRGHDIVINRDSDLERGDATVRGDETPPTEKGSGSSQTQVPEDQSPKREDGTDYREEEPPDGTEIIAEWKEGPHNIIEKRSGPGEDVRPLILNSKSNLLSALAGRSRSPAERVCSS